MHARACVKVTMLSFLMCSAADVGLVMAAADTVNFIGVLDPGLTAFLSERSAGRALGLLWVDFFFGGFGDFLGSGSVSSKSPSSSRKFLSKNESDIDVS